jgi:hypothetical protein
MRSLMRVSLFVALVAGLVFAAGSSSALAGDGPWSIELRVTQIVPADDEGSLDVAGFGNAGAHVVDFQDAVVPEIALGAEVSEGLSLELSLLMANLDTELDIVGAGTLELGDTDMMMFQVAGLYDVAEWDGGRLRLGWIFGVADFDDVDITDAASLEGVRAASLGGDLLYGVNVRFDTDFGVSGWYFSSNLRWYLSGGPDMSISGFASPPAPVLAPPPGSIVLASGEVDFEPLLFSLGLGYRY